jgi:NTP pyrophosphatase (non-canonical NTP hydrolase)
MKEEIKKLASNNDGRFIRMKIEEELHELLEALELNYEPHIVEEMADVYLTIKQYLLKYDLEDEFYEKLAFKIKRTKHRIGLEE